MSKKQIILLIAMVISAVILVIIFIPIINDLHIEDTNGDVTTLVEIDLEQRIEDGKYGSVNDNTSTICTGREASSGVGEDFNCDYVRYSSKKSSGVTVLHFTRVYKVNETIEIDMDIEHTSGNIEIYVIGPDKQILQRITEIKSQSIIINVTELGDYKIVFGMESAEFTVEFNRK